VQAVVAELGGEKVDIIPWSDDPATLVANALSPAQVVGVRIDEELRIANVTVPERMLSLAIGREGQNARLAAKLTGWRIDIRSDVAATTEAPPAAPDVREPPPAAEAAESQLAEAVPAADAEAVSAAEGDGQSGPVGDPVESVGDRSAPVAEAPAAAVVAAKPKRASRATKASLDPTAETTNGPLEIAVGAGAAAEPVAAAKPKRASRARKADGGEVTS
jgi:hypothetical protein